MVSHPFQKHVHFDLLVFSKEDLLLPTRAELRHALLGNTYGNGDGNNIGPNQVDLSALFEVIYRRKRKGIYISEDWSGDVSITLTHQPMLVINSKKPSLAS